MPGIGIISNANARLNKLSPKLKNNLNFILGKRGEVVSTYTLDDVASAVKEFKEYKIDIIAISGGDGTAHRTLEKIIPLYGSTPIPPILLLPSGTQNMIPKSFGITGNSLTTMLLTQARYAHNIPIRYLKRNLMRVNEHYSFMFGVGIAPRFLDIHYKRGTTPTDAATLLGRLIVDAFKGGSKARRLIAPMPMWISSNGGKAERVEDVHTVMLSFAEELALRFKPFPKSGWQEGIFEALISNANLMNVVFALPLIWSGSTNNIKGFKRSLINEMKIKLDHPESFTLDGDLYPPESEFYIRSGPELKFLVPRITPMPRNIAVRSGKAGPWGSSFFV